MCLLQAFSILVNYYPPQMLSRVQQNYTTGVFLGNSGQRSMQCSFCFVYFGLRAKADHWMVLSRCRSVTG